MNAHDVEDLFRPFAAVTIKRMFGGLGIYSEDMMFAIEAGGEIYIKSDAETAPAFEAAGLRAFEFTSKRGVMITSYRLLPEAAHEDADVLREWCARAFGAARRALVAKMKMAVPVKAKSPASKRHK